MNGKIFLFCLSVTLVIGSSLSGFSKDNRGIDQVTGKAQISRAVWGKYHALIIGINNYKEWPELRTAVKDARSLKGILVKRYGFGKDHVILRTDGQATRLGLIRDLRNLASKLGSQDNLLVYFAGHGQIDDLTGDGYWIPVEGKLKDPATWISHSTVKNILSSEKLRAKNIVVVADSCYSGILLRGGPSLLTLNDHAYKEKLAKLASRRSRQVICSGGLEPVVDGGRDGHSLFAYYFLTALKENKRDVIDLENLFHTKVWKYVTEIGGQRPNVGRLKTPMDEDGQFVLVIKVQIVTPPSSPTATEIERKRLAKERKRLEAERKRLAEQRRRLEEERKQAAERERLARENAKLEAERKQIEEERRRLEKAKKQQVAGAPSRPSISRLEVIDRDGMFAKYSNGVVRDTRTSLEWLVGPDRNMNWYQAREWVQSLSTAGGGWRMPTVDELKTLYQKGKGSRNITPLLKTTGWLVWSGETEGSSEAWTLYLRSGRRTWDGRKQSNFSRAFAVRSGR
jgi:uncharacterized caspase-like protein